MSHHHLGNTLQGTNISPTKALLKMIFLFPRWDMLIPWRVCLFFFSNHLHKIHIYLLRTRKKNSLRHLAHHFRPFFRFFFPFEAPWHLTSSEVLEGGWTIFLPFLGPPKSYGWHIKARWWFQIFFCFHPYLGKWFNLTNFFRWVETSTRLYLLERVPPETKMAVEHRKNPKL